MVSMTVDVDIKFGNWYLTFHNNSFVPEVGDWVSTTKGNFKVIERIYHYHSSGLSSVELIVEPDSSDDI